MKILIKAIGVVLFYLVIYWAYFRDTDNEKTEDPLWPYILANLSAILAFFLLIF